MSDYLIHHGIKGMKWGIRKYQNADGSLTPAGKQKYGHSLKGTMYRLSAGAHEKIYSKIGNKTMRSMSKSTAEYARKKADEADAAAAARKEAKFKERASRRAVKKAVDKTINNSDSVRSEKVRKYAVRGLAVAGTALAAYGAYKAVKAYNKMKYEPYYDVIGNYIDPKLSGPRSAGSMVRAELRRIRGQARYDSLGNYIESTKDYLERANKYAPRPKRRH